MFWSHGSIFYFEDVNKLVLPLLLWKIGKKRKHLICFRHSIYFVECYFSHGFWGVCWYKCMFLRCLFDPVNILYLFVYLENKCLTLLGIFPIKGISIIDRSPSTFRKSWRKKKDISSGMCQRSVSSVLRGYKEILNLKWMAT